MKKYSKEFKDSTVQLIINNNENVKKVAKDLDINPVTLYSWVTAYKKDHNIPLGNNKLSAVVAKNEPPMFNWALGPNMMPLGLIKIRLALPLA